MRALRECPFCGREAEFLPDRLMAPGAEPPVFCNGCHASALDAAAWNRRHVPEGFVLVPVKLLDAAHACMRETGWHLAPAHAARGSDGILEAACAEIAAQVGELLAAALKAQGGGE